MECPRCRSANPRTSQYCGTCAAPLHPLPGPPLPADAEPPSLTTTLDPLVRALAPGTVVAGKYRILGEIGRGGMGVVYEADDLKLRRAVALKFLPAELTDDPEARGRFLHEAQAASALDHPHICTIHEIGEGDDGRMFIAMALCHGESLRSRIKRGPLAPPEALDLAAQIASGLAVAHASGVVHRDVKPANILVSNDGTARVADFGLAKMAGEARLTRAGRVIGTVAYMSPEQLRGEDVDARTDVWSLGVVLYEMLTGALPFHGTDEHSLAYAIVHGEAKPPGTLPPGTPEACARLIARALAKDPAARFASAVEMAGAIAAIREAEGYTGHVRRARASWPARPAAGEGRPGRPAVVRYGVPVLAAAAILALALALDFPHRLAGIFGLARSAAPKGITIFTPTVLGESRPDHVLASGLAEYLRLRLDAIARRSRSWITPGDHLDAYEVREASDAQRVLGSDIVVTGTLKRVADTLSLTLDVVDPSPYRRLTSIPKTDHIANIATWQDDLIRETAVALGLPLSTEPPASSAIGMTTTVPGAFEAYIRGLGLMMSTDLGASPISSVHAEAVAAAVAAFEEAARLDPSFAAASIELADAYRLMPGPESPQAVGSPAIARAEAVLKTLLATNDSLPRVHSVLASIFRRLGRTDDAVRELERAAALDAFSYDTQIRLATLYEDANQPLKAEAAYRAAVAIRPGYWAGALYLGLFHFYRGAFDKARDEFEGVTRRCPANILALNSLGAADFKLGDSMQAIATFEHSNGVKRNPEACSNLAVLYYYSGRYADSVNAGEAAVGFGPADSSNLIWGNLADAYRFTPGNEAKADAAYAKAIAFTEQALTADPADARSHARLAVFLAKTGQAARARDEIERALAARPGDADIALHAVIVRELGGERAKALEAVREYVRLGGPINEIVHDPFLAALRRDPDYAAVTSK